MAQSLLLPSPFLGFLIWFSLHDAKPADDRLGLSQREKKILAWELAGPADHFKLDLKGEGNKTRSAREKPGDGS